MEQKPLRTKMISNPSTVKIDMIGFGTCDYPYMCDGKNHTPCSSKDENVFGSFGQKTLYFQPSRPFRPSGILIWNPGVDTLVTSILVGPQEQLVGPAPGDMFKAKFALSEMMLVLSRDEYLFRNMVRPTNGTELTLPSMGPANRMNITINGSFDDVAVWGYTLVSE